MYLPPSIDERQFIINTGKEYTVYEYDAAGNLLTRTDAAGVAETYSYAAAGNLISRIPEAVADAAGADAGPGLGLLGQSGNIAGADPLEGLDLSSAVYGYNGKNQMILAETDGGKTENVFNAEGLRIAKIARQSGKIRLEEML